MATSVFEGHAAVADRPGFDVLDDVVRLADARGLVAVRVALREDVAAVASHVERRAVAVGRRVARAGEGVESAWRDAAQRLGLPSLAHDPREAAQQLRERARAERAVVIASPGSGSWDRVVTRALAEEDTVALFVVIASADEALALEGVTAFDVETELEPAGLARWWDAVAAAQSQRQDASLGSLQSWLERATRAPAPSASLAISEAGRRLLARLALASRAWPTASLAALGPETELEELVRLGLVEVRDGLVVARSMDFGAPDGADLAVVAGALEQQGPSDPWARGRAAELRAVTGDLGLAWRSMGAALAAAEDSATRAELWSRWRAIVDALPPEGAGALRLTAAELALELGDVEVSIEWAQRASGEGPKARAAFVLGRAALARGDLVSANAALTRARELAEEPRQAQAAAVQIAEALYAGGDLEAAEATARGVLAESAEPSLALGARNLLGKLLLARGDWAAADAHFAQDECDAACAGDFTGELRARVNRAIALLSRGSSDQAGVMLNDVLEAAQARGSRRAVGFALSNLAVLAIERHDYARALSLLERTIVEHRRAGDRLNFARDISNLVELRLRLGLVEQAEQAIRFGRNALGPGAPASRLTEVALAATHVHLARGRTLEAEREVRNALRTASQSSDGDKLGECHRMAARIALEDGVVQRAQAELARASELSRTAFDRAEVALLEALAVRASGRPARALAEHAVTLARECGDEELAREAHVLCAEAALAEDDLHAARAHETSARALRDEVVCGLPAALREAYLARPALMRLSLLERAGEPDVEVAPRELPSVLPPRRAGVAPRYVGRHPTVRALLDSVRRVGPTGATILIHGESGTGKELVAELIHAASDRSEGPLVKVNCSALVESLLLSELFGHEKGAFTGATGRRLGRFERADGGTLFLDEIGDISPRTQVALLRVLEERRIERVGGTQSIPVNVRIVCATHRDLRALVERGEFREDLYYRLSGIALEVPALRERAADVPALCEAILDRVGCERSESPKRVTAEALELLTRYRWPGNVRELENALRAASVLTDGDVIDVADLVLHVDALRKVAAEAPSRREPSLAPPLARVSPQPEGMPEEADAVVGVAYREIRHAGVSLSDLKRNIERECIARALGETGGNITRAAAVLGMKRPRLSQLVKQYGFLEGSTEDPS